MKMTTSALDYLTKLTEPICRSNFEVSCGMAVCRELSAGHRRMALATCSTLLRQK